MVHQLSLKGVSHIVLSEGGAVTDKCVEQARSTTIDSLFDCDRAPK